jgi:hypothetical protein
MAGYQFAHWDTFSRKGNGRQRTVAEICAEAARVKGNCSHVAEPKPPKLLRGVLPMKALALHDALLTERPKARGKGRGIRQDTHTLAGIVFSYPYSRAELDAAPDRMADYRAWRDETVDWLEAECQRTGQKMLSIVEHVDESHPHIHCLAVPLNARRDAKACHPGHQAAVATPKGDKGAATKAFREKMRWWQDRVFEELCGKYGMARIGPRLERQSRAGWQAKKREGDAVAKVNRSIRKAQGELEQERAALAENDRASRARAFKYATAVQDLMVREQALQKREAKAKEAQAEAVRREAEAQAEKEAAQAARKPLEAVAVALEAWAGGEIVDTRETPEKGQELIYADELLEQRKQDLDKMIRPGFAAAFKIVASLVEIARNAAEEALKRLQAAAAAQARRLRM